MMAKEMHTRLVPFPLLFALAAGGVMLWVWLSSGDQPEGCYRIDKDTHLAMASGKVQLIGHSVDKAGRVEHRIDEAGIMKISVVRKGFLITLDQSLLYDPDGPYGTHFKEASNPPGSQTLFIDQTSGTTDVIPFDDDRGNTLHFPEIACDSLSPTGD